MSNFKKIPFQLGADLLVRSPSNPAHRAKVKLVGVVENSFIIIETPVFAISDNISAIVEGMVICSYAFEGYLFTFKSEFQKEFSRNIICIDYPHEFEVEQIRKHPRIKVNLDAEIVMGDQTVMGRVRDISEGGCLLEIPKMISVFKGIEVTATFTLPDDELVKNMRCKVKNTKIFQIKKYTAIGVAFIAPDAEIQKVVKLCRFCMRFKV